MEYSRLEIRGSLGKAAIVIDRGRLVSVDKDTFFARTVGEFTGTGYCLYDGWDYVLGEDSHGVLCLIPLKKEGT